jgi:hypothetical protein
MVRNYINLWPFAGSWTELLQEGKDPAASFKIEVYTTLSYPPAGEPASFSAAKVLYSCPAEFLRPEFRFSLTPCLQLPSANQCGTITSCSPQAPQTSTTVLSLVSLLSHQLTRPGSFGGYPKEVRTAMRSFQDQAEAEPDKFIRYTFPPALLASRAAIAQILHCPVDSIVLLPNVTTATNTVLRNLRYEKGDKVVYFSGVYGALEKTIEYVVESTAAEAVKIDFTFPKSDKEIIRMFKETLERHRGSVKVAVFDTIVSMPGMRMPFERLVEICREERVLSMIDGAHGIGHIPLDLGKLDPDFFVSNCHK